MRHNNEMRFIGYARVSDKEQMKTGFSIEAQIEAIEQWAGEHGHTLIRIVVEPGRSGSKRAEETRPAFTRTVANVLAGVADGIVVKWIDRFARNVEDWLRVRSQFLQADKQLISISEPLLNTTSNDPIARYLATSIMNAYQLQAELSGLKAAQGRDRRAKSGDYPGAIPWGYIRKGGKILFDPDACFFIVEAFHEFATGRYTLDGWAKEAERRSFVRKGKPVRKNAWHRIFRNLFYTGRYVWKRQEYEGNYQPIIERQTFDNVQGILDANGPGPQQQRHFWLLAGLLWSEPLDKLMTGAMIKGQYAYYRAVRPGCPEHGVRCDQIEPSVVAILETIRWDGSNRRYSTPEPWRLAFRVASSMAEVFHALETQHQKQELLQFIFARYGILVSAGGAIVGHKLRSGFG
jgi:DNA invertase Pin-like site-specific DNA recombinase